MQETFKQRKKMINSMQEKQKENKKVDEETRAKPR
jgi:hypothetical protein